MSRLSIWVSVVLMSALAASGASACPGTFAIGLPFLFGSDEPTSPWPATTDFRPLIDWQLPVGFDEAQDSGVPLGRKELAQECLKVWRQLVREGRFDLAPVVAAKAASLDPTNFEVQQAVLVSQVLRTIDEKTRQAANQAHAGMAPKARIAPARTAAGCEADAGSPFKDVIVQAGHITPACSAAGVTLCPEQCPAGCPPDGKAAPLTRSFQFTVPFSCDAPPALPGIGFTIEYLFDLATAKKISVAPSNASSMRAGAGRPWTFSESPLPKLQNVQSLWEHSIVTKDNKEGLAGRIYLFADGKPHVGNGSLKVVAHQVLSDKKTVPIQAWEIDAVTLQKLGATDIVGWGYTVFLPLVNHRPEGKCIELHVQFTPDHEAPLTSQPVTLALNERCNENMSGLTPAGRLMPDLNVPLTARSFTENTTDLPTENELIAQRALKHLFPGGILDATSACGNVCTVAPNPIANSIPARELPAQYLAPSKHDLQLLPLSALAGPKVTNYRLAAGDVIGIHIDGMMDHAEFAANLQKIGIPEFPSGAAYPLSVHRDGTVLLPLLNRSLYVANRTLGEAEALIARAYSSPKKTVDLDKHRLRVAHLFPRSCTVQVMWPNLPVTTTPASANSATETKNIAVTMSLTENQNDILNVLTRTGDVKIIDSLSKISIQRRLNDGSTMITHIPLRVPKGDQFPFPPCDVILQTGDVVVIERRDNEVFEVEGLPSAREFKLPRDADVPIMDALELALSTLVDGDCNNLNKHFHPSRLTQLCVAGCSVSVIRQTKDNGQITIRVDLANARKDPRENILIQNGDRIIMPVSVSAQSEIGAKCDHASPLCGSAVVNGASQGPAGMTGSIVAVGHAVSAEAKRVTIKTASWQLECDRVVMMNDREVLVEGNVTMRQRDISVQANRVHINLLDGRIQAEAK